MGCDIHPYWEVRKASDEPWVSLFPRAKNKYWDAEEAKEAEEKGEKYWEPKFCVPQAGFGSDEEFYIGRNYHLFATLAGVRDYGNTTPIAEPRGIPDDVSPEIAVAATSYGGDGHSHSYLTVKEIEDFDWGSKCTKTGIVSEEVYKEWKAGGEPYPNCQGVGGGGIEHVSRETMDKIISGEKTRNPDKTYYTSIEWEESHDSSADYFLDVIKAIKEKAKDDFNVTNPADIRMVFFFDN